jgi:hypothetical protein
MGANGHFFVDRGCPMEYIIEMHTVVETPSYIRGAEKVFSSEEREAVVAMVSGNPDCGDVITGTSGFRKVRFGRGGMGKRGGVRIIYIFRNGNFPVFLIAVYAKNEKENLTNLERNHLAKRADDIFTTYGRKP